MPAEKVVDDGTYAVLVSDVSTIYKTDFPALPPDVPAVYALMVMPKGVGKPQCPQLRFATAVARDAFYTRLVTAMS